MSENIGAMCALLCRSIFYQGHCKDYYIKGKKIIKPLPNNFQMNFIILIKKTKGFHFKKRITKNSNITASSSSPLLNLTT